MRNLDLREWERSDPIRLSASEIGALRSVLPPSDLGVDPADGLDGAYRLTPFSTVGAVEVGGLSVLIRPKIDIPQTLSLACYASDLARFQRSDFDFAQADALPDILALALARHARRAFSRGLLHGYREEEDALHTVRGRIRFDEMIRRRFGAPPPVDVRYDEFTDDILENRLVKAAAARLAAARLRSRDARRGLGRISATLDNVSLTEFRAKEPPAPRFDRLNEHYRGVVALSRLILRLSAFESRRGTAARAAGFLINMNELFQRFVTRALRETLRASDATLRSDANLPRKLTLDEGPTPDAPGRVSLLPDLTWWEGGDCLFVGDVKYKKVSDSGGVPNADLYQLLAYAAALDLPGGTLIYAKGEAREGEHIVRRVGKRLRVAALDLSGDLDAVLNRVSVLARDIAAARDEARREFARAKIANVSQKVS